MSVNFINFEFSIVECFIIRADDLTLVMQLKRVALLRGDVIDEPIYPVPIFDWGVPFRARGRSVFRFFFVRKWMGLFVFVSREVLCFRCVRVRVGFCMRWVFSVGFFNVWRIGFVRCWLWRFFEIEFFEWHLLKILYTKYNVWYNFWKKCN